MSIPETNEVGQAVFGYSNGHRLLASTLQLSSVDVYELAAVSDLAPGARISGDASYLTGLLLPDSRLYALVRTWLAPEMPRPGCVWSHVLLLDHIGMATQVDLTVVADLHRRPNGFTTDPGFSAPLRINRRLRAAKVDLREAEKVMLACYADFTLNDAVGGRDGLERAILCVWSQQWPRLRRQFTFRSVSTSTDLKGQSLQIRHETRLTEEVKPRPAWLRPAALDATSETVTSLRRFLWRYGKDIPTRKPLLPDLVSLHEATRSKRMTHATAERILKRFPEGQADTLKRDMLGFSTGKTSLVPSLGAVDLVRVMAGWHDLEIAADGAAFALAVTTADRNDLACLPAVLTALREELGDRFDLLFDSVVPLLDVAMIEDSETPIEFVLRAVARRPELLSPLVIRRLADDEIRHLWPCDLSPEQRGEIVRVAMQRPRTDGFDPIVLSDSRRTLRAALDLQRTSGLHADWIALFRSSTSTFAAAIAQSTSGGDLIQAIRLLGFPLEESAVIRPWFAAFASNRSTLSHDDETRLLVYFLVLCMRHDFTQHRDVMIKILAPLRRSVLHDDVPHDARDSLSAVLPSDNAHWDLNKRLLKSFRKAVKSGQQPDPLLNTLDLTDDEYAYATNQDPKDIIRQYIDAFNPWTYLK